MFIIAGLGNPGRDYAHTRHNVGFDVIDALAEKYDIRVETTKHKALEGTGMIAGRKVLLVKPQTFMNLSGEAVRAAVDYYGADPERELIIISDDIALDPGSIRIRLKGSAGGHNGLKNIILHLGSSDFMRIRVGVGDKPEKGDLVNHVLGHFDKATRAEVDGAIGDAVEAIELILEGEAGEAMNRFNKKKTQPAEEDASGS